MSCSKDVTSSNPTASKNKLCRAGMPERGSPGGGERPSCPLIGGAKGANVPFYENVFKTVLKYTV